MIINSPPLKLKGFSPKRPLEEVSGWGYTATGNDLNMLTGSDMDWEDRAASNTFHTVWAFGYLYRLMSTVLSLGVLFLIENRITCLKAWALVCTESYYGIENNCEGLLSVALISKMRSKELELCIQWGSGIHFVHCGGVNLLIKIYCGFWIHEEWFLKTFWLCLLDYNYSL